MEKIPLVSIVVPVYNVEKYLPRCMESLVNQTFSRYEIVLVNDGSTDGSAKICRDYSEWYSNVTVITQSNQGLSMARNNGIYFAKAQYIFFVDSDDYITNDCIEYLWNLTQKYDADVAVGNTYLVYNYDQEFQQPRILTEECLTPEQALIRMCYKDGFSNSAWGKLYKRGLVEKYPYPKDWLFEDLATTYKILGDSNRVVYGNKEIYFYVQRNGSIVRKPIDERMLMGVEAAQQQIEYIQKFYPNAVRAAEYCYIFKIVQYIPNLLVRNDANKEAYKKIRALQKKYSHKVWCDRKARWTVVVRSIAISLGYLPTRIVGCLFEKRKKIYL